MCKDPCVQGTGTLQPLNLIATRETLYRFWVSLRSLSDVHRNLGDAFRQ